ncbi:hypothetical protein BLOT_014194 [Blomia tropicalis]|nr:hypothetical protein BLOT_014194 [Blomia tropicalis]
MADVIIIVQAAVLLCLVIVAIFSVGFVGTIAESIRALLAYACLLILFPVSVLLVEIILRLSTMSPIPIQLATSSPPTTNITAPMNVADEIQSLLTPMSTTPKATLIFSNSFTSIDQSSSSVRNMSVHEMFQPPLNALLPSPSNVSNTNQRFPYISTPMPTDFYILFKDGGYVDNPSRSTFNSRTTLDHTNSNETAIGNNRSQPTTTFLKASQNFWSDIFTTSLSPRVEILVEYLLIGMLAFVLVQIAVAYLLASEIRTLRSELSFLSSLQIRKRGSSHEDDDSPNCPLTEIHETNVDKESSTNTNTTTLIHDFLPCFDGTLCQVPSNSVANCTNNGQYSSDFCLLTFQQSLPIPMVQVHSNPEVMTETSMMANLTSNDINNVKNNIGIEHGNSFNTNYVNVIIDETLANKATQFASNMSSSSSSLTSHTNRRNRMGSFRVTFDSAPEYFGEANNERDDNDVGVGGGGSRSSEPIENNLVGNKNDEHDRIDESTSTHTSVQQKIQHFQVKQCQQNHL